MKTQNTVKVNRQTSSEIKKLDKIKELAEKDDE